MESYFLVRAQFIISCLFLFLGYGYEKVNQGSPLLPSLSRIQEEGEAHQ